jgi:peptide/nickel transport system ATP-binding protein
MTAEATPLLEVRDLAVHFPIRRGLLGRQVGSVRAVDGVSFSIGKGETLGLVGESGCGKSTTGLALMRLVTPTAGAVRLNGHDVASLSARELKAHRRRMQIVFQDPYSSSEPAPAGLRYRRAPLDIHGSAPLGSARQRSPISWPAWVCALIKPTTSPISSRVGSGSASGLPAP